MIGVDEIGRLRDQMDAQPVPKDLQIGATRQEIEQIRLALMSTDTTAPEDTPILMSRKERKAHALKHGQEFKPVEHYKGSSDKGWK